MYSIIIPTRNRVKCLEKTIESYLGQDGVSEVIIIDDASSDDTSAFIRKKSADNYKIKYYRNEIQLGALKSKALGVSLAKNETVLIGEDDVFLADDYLKKCVVFLNQGDRKVVSGRIIYLKEGESESDALTRARNYKRGCFFNRWLLVLNHKASFKRHYKVPFTHALFVFKKVTSPLDVPDVFSLGNGFREESLFQILISPNGAVVTPEAVCFHLSSSHCVGGGQRELGRFRILAWTLILNSYFVYLILKIRGAKYLIKAILVLIFSNSYFLWKTGIRPLLGRFL